MVEQLTGRLPYNIAIPAELVTDASGVTRSGKVRRQCGDDRHGGRYREEITRSPLVDHRSMVGYEMQAQRGGGRQGRAKEQGERRVCRA